MPHTVSNKQLLYLDYLCSELGLINKYRYRYCSTYMASKEIERLEKKLKKAKLPEQLSLI